MDIADSIAQCRGLDVAEIATRFAETDQDEVTKVIVELFGERTALDRLPSVPFAVRHVMYGETDVSEWRLDYDAGGFTVADDASGAGDAAIRWEHWEDAVRLLNGDIAALSLLYARRVVVEGADFDEPNAAEPPWFRAVDFAPQAAGAEHGRVLSDLVAAHQRGAKERAAYVQHVGLERIVAARAFVVADTLIDAGATAELEGSFMRLIVPGQPPIGVQAEFAPSTGEPRLRILTVEEQEGHDTDEGITLRYATPQAIVAVSSGEKTFEQLIVGGEVRVDGSPERLDRFARALTKLAELYG